MRYDIQDTWLQEVRQKTRAQLTRRWGGVLFIIWPPAGSGLITLYWLSSDHLPALVCTLFSTSLLWRVCYLLVILLAIWMPGQQGRLLLSSRSVWGACRNCATQFCRAQTKTRLCVSHHSCWSVCALEV